MHHLGAGEVGGEMREGREDGGIVKLERELLRKVGTIAEGREVRNRMNRYNGIIRPTTGGRLISQTIWRDI